jgi:hypothetical protein
MNDGLVAALGRDAHDIANAVTERFERERPDLFAKYPDTGRARCTEDNVHHVEHLAAALDIDDVGSFEDYREWADAVLEARGIPTDDLAADLRILSGVLAERYGPAAEPAVRFIAAAIER